MRDCCHLLFILIRIDHCFLQGGGEVVIPTGDYLVSSLRIRSNVTLHLEKDAHLIGSRNPRDYDVKDDTVEPYNEDDMTTAVWSPAEGYENVSNGSANMVENGTIDKKTKREIVFFNKCLSTWNNSVIKAVDAHNIEIIFDDGAYINGRDCFDETGEEHYRGPHAFNMHRCENVRFKGVVVKNSGNWAFALFNSSNISVENVLVEGGHDGVHMTSCDNVTIRNSELYCGDDCVAGLDNVNIIVDNCVLNTACSAMRFGGTNAIIQNSKIYGPAKFLFRGSLSDEEKRSGAVSGGGDHRFNMLSLFTFFSDYSREIRYTPSNIKIKNCKVSNADRFLHFNFSGNEPWQRNKPLASIEFENVCADNIKNPVTVYGDAECPVSLKIEGCSLYFAEGREELPFMYLCNAEKVILKNTVVKNFKNDVLIKRWNDMGDIIFDDFVCEEFKGETSVITDEPFECKAI